MRELADAVTEAQAAARQASFGSGVTELDFDDVAEHALQAIAAVPGGEGALLETLGPSGSRRLGRCGPFERGGRRGGHRDAGRREPPGRRGRLRVFLRGAAPDGASLRCRRAAADRRRPRRDAQRFQPHELRAVRYVDRRRDRTARGPGHAGALERTTVHRGARPRRPRSADAAPQPPLLPRASRARGGARAPLPPPGVAARPRRRRLRWPTKRSASAGTAPTRSSWS